MGAKLLTLRFPARDVGFCADRYPAEVDARVERIARAVRGRRGGRCETSIGPCGSTRRSAGP